MKAKTLECINTAYLADYDTLADITSRCTVIDLSLPSNKLQAGQAPKSFVKALKLPIFLKNIDAAPELLETLGDSDLPLNEIYSSCSQNFYLKSIVEKKNLYSKVFFTNYPIRKDEQREEEAFLPAADFMDKLAKSKTICKESNILDTIVKGWVFDGESDKISSYLSKVLRTDIMEKTTVSDELKYYRFISTVASMTATVVNYTTLANNVGITAPTAKMWLKFLEGTGLIYLIYPMENVTGKRLMKAPKLYFRDTGICCNLLQLKDSNALIQSAHFKKLFENLVMNLIQESYIENSEVLDWCFYRDSNAKEINAIIKRDGTLYPIMIDVRKISPKKLDKTFDLIKGYAEENGLNFGTGAFITCDNESRVLDTSNPIIQINAKDLCK